MTRQKTLKGRQKKNDCISSRKILFRLLKRVTFIVAFHFTKSQLIQRRTLWSFPGMAKLRGEKSTITRSALRAKNADYTDHYAWFSWWKTSLSQTKLARCMTQNVLGCRRFRHKKSWFSSLEFEFSERQVLTCKHLPGTGLALFF